MNEDTTSRLDEILKKAGPKDFSKFSEEDLKENLPSLADYLNEYIAKEGLVLSDIVKKSTLSKDYAYAILNGNRSKPTKDRIIALCLAMHMDLKSVQRALKLCEMVLYSKNKRDAAFIICFNNEIYDIDKVNSFLEENNLAILETSKLS
ncbi:MAG: hypothetical protein IKP88_18320 [Lachnospiraceae bacterium]|nr:hypothetical protein [Lachnospiraceae bacterium]